MLAWFLSLAAAATLPGLPDVPFDETAEGAWVLAQELPTVLADAGVGKEKNRRASYIAMVAIAFGVGVALERGEHGIEPIAHRVLGADHFERRGHV